MGTSLTLFRMFGIPVRMHWSFLLILVYGAFIFSQRAGSVVIGALYGVLVMLLLFLCVTLHEFGHAVVARHYHIKVPSITLLPIGGVANLERMPDRPSQELAIAIAGPLVNIAIALLLLPVAAFSIGGFGFGGGLPTPRMLASNMMTPGFTNLIIYLLSTNILLVIFNLLPAFPMDGGRVLRALLAMAVPYVRATRIAVYVGRIMALIFAVVGIAGGGIFLLLIAFFVYVGGSAELENVTNRSVLRNIDVDRALRPQQLTLFTSDRLNRAVTLLMTSHQSVYAVLDLSSQFAGAITRAKLIETLRAQGEDARVVDAMTPANEIPTGHSDQTLADIWDIMMKSGSRIVAIIDDRLFRGLVTLDDLGEVVHLVTTTGRYSQPNPVTVPPAGLPGSMDRGA